MNKTKKIADILKNYNEKSKDFNSQILEIENNPRLSDFAKKEDKKAITNKLEKLAVSTKDGLRAAWSELKQSTASNGSGDLQEVAQVLTIMTASKAYMTPELFDNLISDKLRHDVGSMRQIRAAAEAAGIGRKITGCNAIRYLAAVEALDNAILTAERDSYNVIENYNTPFAAAISYAVTMGELQQIETALEDLENY